MCVSEFFIGKEFNRKDVTIRICLIQCKYRNDRNRKVSIISDFVIREITYHLRADETRDFHTS